MTFTSCDSEHTLHFFSDTSLLPASSVYSNEIRLLSIQISMTAPTDHLTDALLSLFVIVVDIPTWTVQASQYFGIRGNQPRAQARDTVKIIA
jgi:hypothetical protein